MQTIWLSPTDYVTGDPSLSIKYPSPATGQPSTVITSTVIRRHSVVDGWVSMGLRLPENIKIQDITICYQVLGTGGSSISEIHLSEMSPDGVSIRYSNGTVLRDTTATSHRFEVNSIVATRGAISLDLKLTIHNGDKILLGAVRVSITDPTVIPFLNAAALGFSPSNSGDQNSDCWDELIGLTHPTITLTNRFHIIFPPGRYQFSRTLMVTSQMTIEGAYGTDADDGTHFYFPPDITGWYCNAAGAQPYSEGLTCNADGSSTVILSEPTNVLYKNKDIDSWIVINGGPLNRIVSISGTRMIMRDPVPTGTHLSIEFATLGRAVYYAIQHIRSTGQWGNNHRAHGIEIRSPGTVEHCFFESFTGNGVSVIGHTRGGVEVADKGMLRDVLSSNNRGNGFYFEGSDANVWTVESCAGTVNGGWGLADASLVGNFFAGNQFADNWGGLLYLQNIVGVFNQGEKFTSSMDGKIGVNSSFTVDNKNPMMVSGLFSNEITFTSGEIITGEESHARAEVVKFSAVGAYGNSYAKAHHVFIGNYIESAAIIYVIGESMSIGESGGGSDTDYIGEGFAQKGRNVYSTVDYWTDVTAGYTNYSIGGKQEETYARLTRDLGNTTPLTFHDSFHSRQWGRIRDNRNISFARELSAYPTPNHGPAFSVSTEKSVMRYWPKHIGAKQVVFHNGFHLRYNRFDYLNESVTGGPTFENRLLHQFHSGATFMPGDIILDIAGQTPGGYAGKICMDAGTIGAYTEGRTVVIIPHGITTRNRVKLNGLPNDGLPKDLKIGQRISINGGATKVIFGVHVKLQYTIDTTDVASLHSRFEHMDVILGKNSKAIGYIDEVEPNAFYLMLVLEKDGMGGFQMGEPLTNLSQPGSVFVAGVQEYWLKLDEVESNTGSIAFVGPSWKGVMPIEP